MDREQIIQWAREVGFDVLLPAEHITRRGGVYTCNEDEISKELEAFAKLVAEHERERVIEAATKLAESKANELIDLEREQCAKLVEDWDSDSADPREVAAAIRARGNI